jgi:hypothetical protein
VAQLAQARVQRDEAVAAEAAVTVEMLDLKARELRHREGDCAKDGVIASLLAQIEEMKQQQQQHHTQSVHIDALKGDVIDDLNGQNQQLQLLLQEQQQQQNLLISQHDQQRSLLQRSCSELQAELSLLQAALNDSRSEAELLRARVAEVEVSIAHSFALNVAIARVMQFQAVCDDLRLDKARRGLWFRSQRVTRAQELCEAEAEEMAASVAAAAGSDGAQLQQIQVSDDAYNAASILLKSMLNWLRVFARSSSLKTHACSGDCSMIAMLLPPPPQQQQRIAAWRQQCCAGRLLIYDCLCLQLLLLTASLQPSPMKTWYLLMPRIR